MAIAGGIQSNPGNGTDDSLPISQMPSQSLRIMHRYIAHVWPDEIVGIRGFSCEGAAG